MTRGCPFAPPPGLARSQADQPVTPADLVEAFAPPLSATVICELLGVPYGEHERFERLSRAQVSRLTTAQDALAGLREMLELIGQTVEEKTAAPGNDIISRLVTEQVATGAVSRAEVVEICQGLLGAGHETTANMIALGTLTFLRHPGLLAEPRDTADQALIDSSVEEMLRYLTVGARRQAPRGDGRHRRRRLHHPSGRGRDRRPSSIQTSSISVSPPGTTSRSVSASTSAWARRWRARSCPSSTARCCAGSPRCTGDPLQP
jgi:hypothetical protein